MFKESISVGLDIGGNSIKMVGLRKKRFPKIEFLRHYDLFLAEKVTDHKDLNTTVITQVLRELIHQLPYPIRKVHTTLSGINTEIRSVEIPMITRDEIKAALRWNLMSTISAEIENFEYDYQVLRGDKSTNRLIIIVGLAARKTLDRQLEILSRLHLEALSVDIDSLAIYNCFLALQHFSESRSNILLNIGAEKTTIIVVHPDHDPFISSQPIGGNQITRRIESSLHISFQDAEKQKVLFNSRKCTDPDFNDLISLSELEYQKILNDFSNSLTDLINKANIQYQILYGEEPATKIFLTGGGAYLHRLDMLIAQQTKFPVFHWNPLENQELEFDTTDQTIVMSGPLYTTAIGLALRD